MRLYKVIDSKKKSAVDRARGPVPADCSPATQVDGSTLLLPIPKGGVGVVNSAGRGRAPMLQMQDRCPAGWEIHSDIDRRAGRFPRAGRIALPGTAPRTISSRGVRQLPFLPLACHPPSLPASGPLPHRERVDRHPPASDSGTCEFLRDQADSERMPTGLRQPRRPSIGQDAYSHQQNVSQIQHVRPACRGTNRLHLPHPCCIERLDRSGRYPSAVRSRAAPDGDENDTVSGPSNRVTQRLKSLGLRLVGDHHQANIGGIGCAVDKLGQAEVVALTDVDHRVAPRRVAAQLECESGLSYSRMALDVQVKYPLGFTFRIEVELIPFRG